ncbi:MAG: hypothetical protein ACREXP_16610 [Steroidobacteraceae bacterium]
MPASVNLQLYDGRDLLIREIRSSGTLPQGEHSLSWDLRDSQRRLVPAEAYTYALEARDAQGRTVRHDVADATGGDDLAARDVKWDAANGRLSYVLDRPVRVSIRIGLSDGGPLLRTLRDWVVRPAGAQQESWDGKDASGVIAVGAHPKLNISVQAFALPENSILVGAPPASVNLVRDLPADTPARPKSASAPKRMYAHSQQSLESRGDFNVHLTLPKTLARSADVAIVSEPIAVRLDVAAADRERALSRRFEPVFFIDGQFAFENEVGFVPMTWNFDPATLNEGEHYLTVNLRGYEGNFGIATVKILVKHRQAASR